MTAPSPSVDVREEKSATVDGRHHSVPSRHRPTASHRIAYKGLVTIEGGVDTWKNKKKQDVRFPVFKSSSNRTKNNKEQIKQDVRFQSSQVQTEQKNTMSFKLLPIKLSSNDDPTLMERDEDGRDFVILGDGAAGFLYEGHRIDHIPSCPELALEMMGRVKRGDGKLLCGSITNQRRANKEHQQGCPLEVLQRRRPLRRWGLLLSDSRSDKGCGEERRATKEEAQS